MAKAQKPSDFPEYVAGKRRQQELQSASYAANQRAVALESEPVTRVDSAVEAQVAALVGGGAMPETFDLNVTGGRHADEVREAWNAASILRQASERFDVEFSTLHGEISNRCLQARKGEIVATQRAQIALALRLIQARNDERALRSQMERDDIRGAETAWSLSLGSYVDQLGQANQPDSLFASMLREAEEMGVITAKEAADIRAGRPFTP